GRQHLALEDPDLHADRPVRRVGGGDAEVQVGSQRLQRHPAVPVRLPAGDLRPGEPPRARDLDPLGAEPDRALDRLLHRPPERDPLLQLEGDVLRHQLRVQLGVDHLLDVQVDLLAGPRLELVLEPLHLGPLAADDDARPRGVDGDPHPVGGAIQVDPRDAGVVERVLDVAPDLAVLVEEVGVLLRREPARAPRPRGAEPEPDRVDLLPHHALLVVWVRLRPPARPRSAAGRAAAPARPGSPRRRGARARPSGVSASCTVTWASRCRIQNARPIARGWMRFRRGPSSISTLTRSWSSWRTWWLCSALATAERSTFSMCRAATCGECCRSARASPTVRPRTRLATRRALRGDSRRKRPMAFVSMAPSRYLSAVDFSVCEPWARNVRVGANSPSLWPTMFSVTYTGMNFLPLCTASVWPTKSGLIVDRRDQVLITRFWREAL